MHKHNTTSSETDASEKDTIQRSPHDKQHPYVIINKNLLTDTNISADCSRMLMCLLVKPTNWKIVVKNICSEMKIGRDKCYRLLKEGMEAGYVQREDLLERGRRISCKYYIAEDPIFRGNSKKFARVPDKRDRVHQDVIIYNDINKRNNTKKSEPGGSPPKTPPPEAIIFYKNIGDTGITREEYDKLEKEIGSIELDETLESLSKWLKFDTKRKIKRKGIVQKIKDWNRRYQREKSVLKQREQKIKQEEYNKEKERYNEIIRTNKLEVEELILHRNFKQDVYFDKNLVIVDDGKKRKWYSMNDPGLAKCLEKILEEKKE